MSITVEDVTTRAAALLNDTGKTIFSGANQFPYLNIALDELQETFELNNVPLTNAASAAIVLNTSSTDIGGTTGPALPTDLIEIQGMYERLTGTTNDYAPLRRVDFLPNTTVLTSVLELWTWQNQIVYFIGANTNRDVKMDYISQRISAISSSSTVITVFNAKTFLAYRTAALCAEFIGENPTRAQELNAYASLALDRTVGIDTKGRQAIATRHRPFMSAFKHRGF